MTILLKHVVHQGAVLKALFSTFRAAQKQGKQLSQAILPETPGETLNAELSPRSPALIADYVKHVGGNPKAYRDTVPPHLFPQWTFGIASKLLVNLPYPLMRIVNGGCRLEIHSPLPQGEPLEVSAQLEKVDDNGRRAVMTQRLVTGTKSAPNAIEARMYAVVPLKTKGEKTPKTKRAKPRVPEDAKLLTHWKLTKKSGLEFAALTGDFNPIHWITAAAKANGFKSTILHGFATMARSIEGLQKHHLLGAGSLRWIDVQFTRPLVLPATVGLFVRITDTEHQVFVGDAPGGPAYMTGTFEVAQDN